MRLGNVNANLNGNGKRNGKLGMAILDNQLGVVHIFAARARNTKFMGQTLQLISPSLECLSPLCWLLLSKTIDSDLQQNYVKRISKICVFFKLSGFS